MNQVTVDDDTEREELLEMPTNGETRNESGERNTRRAGSGERGAQSGERRAESGERRTENDRTGILGCIVIH